MRGLHMRADKYQFKRLSEWREEELKRDVRKKKVSGSYETRARERATRYRDYLDDAPFILGEEL